MRSSKERFVRNYKLDHFQPKLRAALEQRGWEIERENLDHNNPWIVAVWTLRSRWPLDQPFFLVFKADEDLFWVGITSEEPPDYGFAPRHGHDLYLKRNWERALPELLATLDELRLKAAAGSDTE